MQLRVFPTVEASRQARRDIAPLAALIDQDSLADVKTVVSELVSISVTHGAAQPIEIDLNVDDGRLEGLVDGHGAGARALVRARTREDDSLVLRIIDSLVDEWGSDAGETQIWFRMPVQPI
jgi:anti-sigma regulatory factor (Ser/Thr protein kinase)